MGTPIRGSTTFGFSRDMGLKRCRHHHCPLSVYTSMTQTQAALRPDRTFAMPLIVPLLSRTMLSMPGCNLIS